jgi:hypothetical protein
MTYRVRAHCPVMSTCKAVLIATIFSFLAMLEGSEL